jgi:hypothetical protein
MTAKKYRPPVVLKVEEMVRGLDFSFAYFTNCYLASVAPKAPELANSGVFICSNTGGTATYLLNESAVQRTLTPLPSVGKYYQFEEAGELEDKKAWFFEIDPHPSSGVWAIYYQPEGSKDPILFQTATQIRFVL